MKLTHFIITVALVSMGSGIAYAQPAPDPGGYKADDQYAACMDKSDQTNLAFGQCGTQLVAREEARLQQAWTKVAGQLDPDAKARLLAEQRLWIAFKDKSCVFWANDAGREGQVLNYPLCRAEIVAARRDYLKEIADRLDQ